MTKLKKGDRFVKNQAIPTDAVYHVQLDSGVSLYFGIAERHEGIPFPDSGVVIGLKEG